MTQYLDFPYLFCCSHCGFSKETIESLFVSGNTFDGTLYTDGYFCGPMWDAGTSQLRVCPNCGVIVWRRDINGPFAYAQEDGPRYMGQVNGAHYVAALEAGLARDAIEETYLRTEVWWHWNMSGRSFAGRDAPLSEAERANLQRLLELVPATDRDQQITRAEICRELGEFKACLAELANIAPEAQLPVCKLISKLARAGQAGVAAVRPAPGRGARRTKTARKPAS